MSGWKIRKLIVKFNKTHDKWDLANHKMKVCEREMEEHWENEKDWCESYLQDLARQIEILRPSKYMIKKYDELSYILNY